MSSGLGTATMSIGVSHSNPTSDNITSGCRLRAQSQGQQQTPQQSHQQQSQSQQQTSAQSDQTLQECQPPSSGQKDPRPNPPHGRSKKDNCCLCWWCCCSCSWYYRSFTFNFLFYNLTRKILIPQQVLGTKVVADFK